MWKTILNYIWIITILGLYLIMKTLRVTVEFKVKDNCPNVPGMGVGDHDVLDGFDLYILNQKGMKVIPETAEIVEVKRIFTLDELPPLLRKIVISEYQERFELQMWDYTQDMVIAKIKESGKVFDEFGTIIK